MIRSAYSPFLDSQIWPLINRRNDDIIIATYAKFGHLRMQVIIDELIITSMGQQFSLLPWVELRHPESKTRIARINEFRGRRVLRTHLRADKVYSRSGKYIFVGRDPRDLVFNMFHFLKEADQDWYDYFSRYGAQLNRPAKSFEAFWDNWMKNDGKPIWPYFSHLQSWWEKREEPNVLLIHFLDFKANMEKELRRISEFLDLTIKTEDWPDAVEACGFCKISETCHEKIPMDNLFWNGGNGSRKKNVSASHWKETLTGTHDSIVENRIVGLIGKTGRDWLLKVK